MTWRQFGVGGIGAVWLAMRGLDGPYAWRFFCFAASATLVIVLIFQAGRKWLLAKEGQWGHFEPSLFLIFGIAGVCGLAIAAVITPSLPSPETANSKRASGPPLAAARRAIQIGEPNSDPEWLITPTAEQMGYFYPKSARRADQNGHVVLRCQVGVTGAVRNCATIMETPEGLGFGDAAATIIMTYAQIKPKVRDGVAIDGTEIRIPVKFTLARKWGLPTADGLPIAGLT